MINSSVRWDRDRAVRSLLAGVLPCRTFLDATKTDPPGEGEFDQVPVEASRDDTIPLIGSLSVAEFTRKVDLVQYFFHKCIDLVAGRLLYE